MKTLTIILLLVVSNLSIAQPTMQWQKSLGGTGADMANSIQQTADGGYIVAGHSESNNGDVTGNHGNFDTWIVKLSSTGAIIWQESFGGTDIEFTYSIQQTTDGGYIVAGQSGSNDGDVSGNHGSNDFWVVKLTSTGTIIWQKCLGGNSVESAGSIQQTSDGGYIITGHSGSNDGDATVNQGVEDCWVVKLTNAGALNWQKSYGGTDGDSGNSILQTTDGGYIVAGSSFSNDGDVSGNHGMLDYLVIKLDSIGNLEWQKLLGGLDNESASSIQQTTDGGYIVVGNSRSNDGDVSGNHGGADMWVVKLTNLGLIAWQKCVGGNGNDYGHSIQQTTDGGYIVTGSTHSNDGDVSGNHGGDDIWVVKLTNSGTIIWQKCFGGASYEGASSIQQTTDGGYIAAGNSLSNDGDVSGNHGNFDMWVIKLSANVGIEENSLSELTLYPNPTTGNISIDLGEVKSNIKATLSNSLGQIILSKEYSSTNIINIDVEAPRGIYFLQLESGGEVVTRKIIKE